jgi:FAD/FMN-containing dehydrogenase
MLDEKIGLSDLEQILEIDPVALTCTAEPAVTFEEVVRATWRHGLIPIIVLEHKACRAALGLEGRTPDSGASVH